MNAAAIRINSDEEFVSFRRRGAGKIGVVLVLLSIAFGLATFLVLTGLTPLTPTSNMIFWMLVANGVLLGLMTILIGWQVWEMLAARRRKVPGAVLHARIVGQFGLFAAVPALIIAFFATVTLNRGLDEWFSDRTQTIISASMKIGEAYLEEQEDLVRGDLNGIGLNVNQNKKAFKENRQVFLQQLATLVSLRNLSGAFVIDRKNRKIEASITASRDLGFRAPADKDFLAAKNGDLVIIPSGDGNVIRGLVKLKSFDEHYLYLYRLVNPTVTSQILKAKSEQGLYKEMLTQRTGLEITFAVMYIGIALIFLLAAVWFGMWFADRLVEPIVGLVKGAQKVSLGKLDTKVIVSEGTGDLATLGHTFNKMTHQLDEQRGELVTTNHQLDERRRFIEAVMSGVSSGVIGVDPDGVVTLANRAGLVLLKRDLRDIHGKKFAEVLPEMLPALEQAENKLSGRSEDNISIKVDNEDKNFVVQVTTERTNENEHGVVVTFDDISELVAAQRNSAWADIARRIAHEIKNPLTPIQLAAERLKRKYQNEIVSNPEVFEKCTETIVRQVGDIRAMVDEFASFARMPSAVLETTDLIEVTKDALVLQKASFEDVKFETDFNDDKLEVEADRRLVTQAITNLVKNAKEAIDTRLETSPEPIPRIRVTLRKQDTSIILSVSDNGKGLPKENRGRLTEPYMTTRVKGTGLGLAIVKRIMQDHEGSINLSDAPQDFDGGIGAMISLSFPLSSLPINNKAATHKNNRATLE